MKKIYLSLLSLFCLLGFVNGQDQALVDFESSASTISFNYFESSLDGQPTSVVANPDPSGINNSDRVLEFVRPANSRPWAGAFSSPNPLYIIDATRSGDQLCMKVYMTRFGNVTVKLENPTDGSGDTWLLKQGNTRTFQWQELCFDFSERSEEAPFLPAAGKEWQTLVLFTDFLRDPYTQDVSHYIDDITYPGIRQEQSTLTVGVNMNSYSGSFNTVYVSGAFNGWSGGANPLSDPDGDGIWTGTVQVLHGDHEFKFQVDEWSAQEELTPGSPCTTTFEQFTNRIVSVSGDTEVCYSWNSCSTCTIRSGTVPTNEDVTFSVDMNSYGGSFNTVYVAGAFNGWTDANPLTDADGDGIWTATVTVPSGTQEYKFMVDNWADQEELAPGSDCTNTTDQFTNRVINVAAGGGEVCYVWGSCADCGTATTPTTPTTDQPVTFSVDMNGYSGSFGDVYVAGTFNGWTDANPLTDADGDGIWTATVSIPGGEQEYKFMIDNWADQEELAPGSACTKTTDEFTNRVINVSGAEEVCFVWGSCTTCGGTPPTTPTTPPSTTSGNITFSVDMNGYGGTFDEVYLSALK